MESGVSTRGEQTLRGEPVRQVALVALWALIGLIVPRASVYGGMAPFGVGVAAAVSGPGAVVVYLATVVGYLLPMGTAFPLRYIAAVAAVGGIRWALGSLPAISKRTGFAPVLAVLATAVTGAAMSLAGGADVYKALIVIAESLIAGGFAYFMAVTVHVAGEGNVPTLSAQQQAAIVVTGAVALMAVSAVEFSGISPGRILAVVLVLLLARCGKEQGGAIAGIVLGVTMAPMPSAA